MKSFLIAALAGFNFTQGPQWSKERNPDSYRDAAASQRTLREILKIGHYLDCRDFNQI
ncbi:MAG TPA: hypothetical protein VK483_11605 [Chitinophagaceae bacterium]|nr:hypothetical protein [Chitinophagaceae bacterium]